MRWLHLSDIHYHDQIDKNKILKELEKVFEKEEGVDYLFITGDLRDAPKTKDKDEDQLSKEIAEFIERIAIIIKVEKKNIYIVPGNHDINRREEYTNDLDKLIEACNKHGKDIGDNNNYKEDFIKYTQYFYGKQFDFWHNVTKRVGCTKMPNGLYDILDLDDFTLIRFNTTISYGYKNSDRRPIFIGVEYIRNDLLEKIEDAQKPVIILAHNSIDDLITRERRAIDDVFRIKKGDSKYIWLYLCGDLHQDRDRKGEVCEITASHITSSDENSVFYIGELKDDCDPEIHAYRWNKPPHQQKQFNQHWKRDAEREDMINDNIQHQILPEICFTNMLFPIVSTMAFVVVVRFMLAWKFGYGGLIGGDKLAAIIPSLIGSEIWAACFLFAFYGSISDGFFNRILWIYSKIQLIIFAGKDKKFIKRIKLFCTNRKKRRTTSLLISCSLYGLLGGALCSIFISLSAVGSVSGWTDDSSLNGSRMFWAFPLIGTITGLSIACALRQIFYKLNLSCLNDFRKKNKRISIKSRWLWEGLVCRSPMFLLWLGVVFIVVLFFDFFKPKCYGASWVIFLGEAVVHYAGGLGFILGLFYGVPLKIKR